jgi:hypothetical protein
MTLPRLPANLNLKQDTQRGGGAAAKFSLGEHPPTWSYRMLTSLLPAVMKSPGLRLLLILKSRARLAFIEEGICGQYAIQIVLLGKHRTHYDLLPVSLSWFPVESPLITKYASPSHVLCFLACGVRQTHKRYRVALLATLGLWFAYEWLGLVAGYPCRFLISLYSIAFVFISILSILASRTLFASGSFVLESGVVVTFVCLLS